MPVSILQTLSVRVMCCVAGLLGQGMATAGPQDFVIDPAHTYVTFEVSHLGISTQRGRLGNAAGTATLDAAKGVGQLAITLDARALSTGSELMEKLLRGSSWFAAEQYPVISFSTSQITFAAGQPQRMDGMLTLRGVTRPITLNVTHYACTRLPFGVRLTCGLDAQAVLKRSEFGMDSLLAFVGDEIKLLIQAEAVRQEPASLDIRP